MSMDKRLVLLGVAILLASLLFYPGFYYEPSPKGVTNVLGRGLRLSLPRPERREAEPVLGDRVKEAIQRGEKNLNCIVWVRHHSTTWEKKVNLIRSLMGLENIGGKVINIYPVLSAASVSVPSDNIYSLLGLPNVAFVDLDAPVVCLGGAVPVETIQEWLRTEELPGDGAGVDIYVLDTGAPVELPVDSAVTFVGGSPYDGNGHGSAVIGIIKSIAPRARVHSVKVLRDDGTGTISTVIAGVEHVLERMGEKVVVNVSLGVPESTVCSLKEAFSVLVRSGAEAVVAAGNDPNTPMSPGTCPEVITVGAVSGDNRLTSYSYRRFDVVSYGDQIATAGPHRGREIRGTSFATPVVTGLVARYLSSIRGSTDQVDMERTLRGGSVRTPDGHLLPTAFSLAETPPEPERELIPPLLFIPMVITGISLIISGLSSKD